MLFDNLIDTYDYDAFGNLVNSTGSTPNNYLFAGEQYDLALGLYYNRARYLNTTTGRFWSLDPQESGSIDPLSLHKYLFANADPVDNADPSGLYSQGFGYAVEDVVEPDYINDFGGGPPDVLLGKWARLGNFSRSYPYSIKPDILDRRAVRRGGSAGKIWMDIKPLSLSGVAHAALTWTAYSAAFWPYGITADKNWLREGRFYTVVLGGSPYETLVFNVGGILFYTTNRQDYDRFEEAVQGLKNMTGAIAIGAAGALLANAIAKLPKAPPPGAASEVIDISTKARIAIAGSEAEAETDVGAAAVGF